VSFSMLDLYNSASNLRVILLQAQSFEYSEIHRLDSNSYIL
jgi:hypothetical protein